MSARLAEMVTRKFRLGTARRLLPVGLDDGWPPYAPRDSRQPSGDDNGAKDGKDRDNA